LNHHRRHRRGNSRWRRCLPGSLSYALLLVSLLAGAEKALSQASLPVAEPVVPAATAERQGGQPVRLAGQEVFRVYDPQGAAETVRIYEERLLRIARDPFYAPGLFETEAGEEGVWVLYREARVGFVTEAAAERLGMSAQRRAAEIVDAVQDAVEQYHRRQSPTEWKRALLLLGVATLLLAGAIQGVRWLHRRFGTWLEVRSRTALKVGGQRLGFRSTERLVAFERRALGILRTLLIVLFVIVYLQTAFTIFPLTRGYAFGVIAYLVDPLRFVGQGLLRNVGDFFFIGVIVALARLLLRGFRFVLAEVASGALTLPGIPQDRADPFYKILRLVVVGITVVMIYPYIPGSGTAAFQGVSLFAGALFTLGASSTAGNFIGGLVLAFSGSFRLGDRVRIGDVVGDVVEATLALTRVRTTKNELVTFANANVLNQGFVNYSSMAREEGLILHTTLTIGYDVPWRQVHELLVAAALRTEHVLDEPTPFVLQTALNDFHVAYEINAYTRAAHRMAKVLGELHQNIQDAFAQAGVEILSPEYSALRDGGPSTVPPQETR